MRRVRTPFPCVAHSSVVSFGSLTLLLTAEKASEVFIALSSAFGSKDFFKNKGPDPTVRDGILRLVEFT